MKNNIFSYLGLLTLLILGAAQTPTHHLKHNMRQLEDSELLQVEAQSQVESEATSETAQILGGELDCGPDCDFKFPYLDTDGCPTEGEGGDENGDGNDLGADQSIEGETSDQNSIGVDQSVGNVEGEGEVGCGDENDSGVDQSIADVDGANVEGQSNDIPEENQEESCHNDPSQIYRYPFQNPGEDCPIIQEEDEGRVVCSDEEVISTDVTAGNEGDAGTVYTSSVAGGTININGHPATYLNYETYNPDVQHTVSYTYVLSNANSGVVQAGDYAYVVYGNDAVQFYNDHYGIDPKDYAIPTCTCTCGNQVYTFNYAFTF